MIVCLSRSVRVGHIHDQTKLLLLYIQNLSIAYLKAQKGNKFRRPR